MAEMLYGGELLGGNGSQTPPTKGLTGAQRVQLAHGEYSDSAVRGRIFTMHSGAVTLDAANVTASALGTITFINGFANPPGSGKLISLLRAWVSTVSGTPAGPYFYDYYAGVTVTASATGTIRSTYLNTNTAGSSVAHPLVDVAVAVSGGSTANTLTLGVVGGPAASAVGAGLYGAVDEVRGSIIIPPGTVFGVTAKGAGTSHIVHCSLVWEELPYLA